MPSIILSPLRFHGQYFSLHTMTMADAGNTITQPVWGGPINACCPSGILLVHIQWNLDCFDLIMANQAKIYFKHLLSLVWSSSLRILRGSRTTPIMPINFIYLLWLWPWWHLDFYFGFQFCILNNLVVMDIKHFSIERGNVFGPLLKYELGLLMSVNFPSLDQDVCCFSWDLCWP
jgi:hypothetical protein